MSIKKELYMMLKDGWNFYQACYRLGITPKEGSRLLHENDEKKKKLQPKQKISNYTWCGNFQCRYCSDNDCTLRREEME